MSSMQNLSTDVLWTEKLKRNALLNTGKAKIIEAICKGGQEDKEWMQCLLHTNCPLTQKFVVVNIGSILLNNLQNGFSLENISSCLHILAKYGINLLLPREKRPKNWMKIPFERNGLRQKWADLQGAQDILNIFGYKKEKEYLLYAEELPDPPDIVGLATAELLLAEAEIESYLSGNHPYSERFKETLQPYGDAGITPLVVIANFYSQSSSSSQQSDDSKVPLNFPCSEELLKPNFNAPNDCREVHDMMLGINKERPRDGRHCDLCGCTSPAVRCDKCHSQIFCLSCDDMYHRHPKRHFHLRKAVDTIVSNSRPALPGKQSLRGDPAKMPLPPPRKKKPRSIFDTFRRGSPNSESPPLPRKEFSWSDKLGSIKRFMSNRPLPPLPKEPSSGSSSPLQDISFYDEDDDIPPILPERNVQSYSPPVDKERVQQFQKDTINREPPIPLPVQEINTQLEVKNTRHSRPLPPPKMSQLNGQARSVTPEKCDDRNRISPRPRGNSLGEDGRWVQENQQFDHLSNVATPVASNQGFATIRRHSAHPATAHHGTASPLTSEYGSSMYHSSSATDLNILGHAHPPPTPPYAYPHPTPPNIPPLYPHPYGPYPNLNYPSYYTSWGNLAGQHPPPQPNSAANVEASDKMSRENRTARSHSGVFDQVFHPGQYYPFSPYPTGYGSPLWHTGQPMETPPSPASSIRSQNQHSYTEMNASPHPGGKSAFSDGAFDQNTPNITSHKQEGDNNEVQGNLEMLMSSETCKDADSPSLIPDREETGSPNLLSKSPPPEGRQEVEKPFDDEHVNGEEKEEQQKENIEEGMQQKDDEVENKAVEEVSEIVKETSQTADEKNHQKEDEQTSQSEEQEKQIEEQVESLVREDEPEEEDGSFFSMSDGDTRPTSRQDGTASPWLPTKDWQCEYCTYINSAGTRICGVCCKTISRGHTPLSQFSKSRMERKERYQRERRTPPSLYVDCKPDLESNNKAYTSDVAGLTSALEEAEKEISRGLEELFKLKEESEARAERQRQNKSKNEAFTPLDNDLNFNDVMNKFDQVETDSAVPDTVWSVKELPDNKSNEPFLTESTTVDTSTTLGAKSDASVEAKEQKDKDFELSQTQESQISAQPPPAASQVSVSTLTCETGTETEPVTSFAGNVRISPVTLSPKPSTPESYLLPSSDSASQRRDSCCQTQQETVPEFLLPREFQQEERFPYHLANGHGPVGYPYGYSNRDLPPTSPPQSLHNFTMYDRPGGMGLGMMQRSHSRASLFGGRPSDGRPFYQQTYDDGGFGFGASIYRSLSRASLTGEGDVWGSDLRPLRKPDFYLSMEELVERRRQETMRAQGLELVRMIREAEQQGFTAEDIQVALNNCGKQNPVDWLQENWKNMIETVVTLSTNYGHDKVENDIGIVSTDEARDALRLHKGNIWAAVTECVESRQRKFLELSARGSFSRKEIVAALTANQGSVEMAYAELTKATLKPFLMRIWGPGEGVESQEGAMPRPQISNLEKLSDQIKSQTMHSNYSVDKEERHEFQTPVSDDQNIWDDDENVYSEDENIPWNDYGEENQDEWEELKSDLQDAVDPQNEVKDATGNVRNIETCNTRDVLHKKKASSPVSDESDYQDANQITTGRFASNAYFYSPEVVSPYQSLEDISQDTYQISEVAEAERLERKKNTGFLSKLAALRKENKTKQNTLFQNDKGIKQEAYIETENEHRATNDVVRTEEPSTSAFGLLKQTFTAVKETVISKIGMKTESLSDSKTPHTGDEIKSQFFVSLNEGNACSNDTVDATGLPANLATGKIDQLREVSQEERTLYQQPSSLTSEFDGKNLDSSNIQKSKSSNFTNERNVFSNIAEVREDVRENASIRKENQYIRQTENGSPKENVTIISDLNKEHTKTPDANEHNYFTDHTELLSENIKPQYVGSATTSTQQVQEVEKDKNSPQNMQTVYKENRELFCGSERDELAYLEEKNDTYQKDTSISSVDRKTDIEIQSDKVQLKSDVPFQQQVALNSLEMCNTIVIPAESSSPDLRLKNFIPFEAAGNYSKTEISYKAESRISSDENKVAESVPTCSNNEVQAFVDATIPGDQTETNVLSAKGSVGSSPLLIEEKGKPLKKNTQVNKGIEKITDKNDLSFSETSRDSMGNSESLVSVMDNKAIVEKMPVTGQNLLERDSVMSSEESSSVKQSSVMNKKKPGNLSLKIESPIIKGVQSLPVKSKDSPSFKGEESPSLEGKQGLLKGKESPSVKEIEKPLNTIENSATKGSESPLIQSESPIMKETDISLASPLKRTESPLTKGSESPTLKGKAGSSIKTPENQTMKEVDISLTSSLKKAESPLTKRTESPFKRTESPLVKGKESPSKTESSIVKRLESASIKRTESPIVRTIESPSVKENGSLLKRTESPLLKGAESTLKRTESPAVKESPSVEEPESSLRKTEISVVKGVDSPSIKDTESPLKRTKSPTVKESSSNEGSESSLRKTESSTVKGADSSAIKGSESPLKRTESPSIKRVESPSIKEDKSTLIKELETHSAIDSKSPFEKSGTISVQSDIEKKAETLAMGSQSHTSKITDVALNGAESAFVKKSESTFLKKSVEKRMESPIQRTDSSSSGNTDESKNKITESPTSSETEVPLQSTHDEVEQISSSKPGDIKYPESPSSRSIESPSLKRIESPIIRGIESPLLKRTESPIDSVRPQSPFGRMSFTARKEAIALERNREFYKVLNIAEQGSASNDKPYSPITSKPAYLTTRRKSIREQLAFERRVRNLVQERKIRTYKKAEIVVQLLDMDFIEEESINAAQHCSTLDQAVSFLQQECELCAGKYPVSQMVSMIHCAHEACKECIRAYFTIQIRDRNIMELLCPFCNEPDITDEDVAQDYFNHLDIMLKKLVSFEIHELFQQKLRDRVLMKDPNFQWCSQCSSGFIAIPDLKKLMCPDCGAITCAQCRKPWEKQHDRMTCEQFLEWKEATDPEIQAAGLAKHLTENGIDCPNCHFKYSLAKGGCMHFRCIQCQYDFCSGCSHPFRMGQKCGVSEFCGKLGLHAHHPRNCLFYLRDKEPEDLQKLLELHNVPFNKDPPEGMEVKDECQVMEQKETPSGLVDDICGKEVVAGYAGLCRIHYVEYLGEMVNKHKLDPIAIFSNDDLELVLKRASIRLPPKAYNDSQEAYRERLTKKIQEELPLDKIEGS